MRNEILLGDCLLQMSKILAQSVDMILCDLPYGTTACSWDTVIPFAPLWKEYERIIKPRGVIVLTSSQPFTSALVMSNPKLFRYELIWEKPSPSNPLLANKRVMKFHENILVFFKKQGTYNPQKKDKLWNDTRKATLRNTPSRPEILGGKTTLNTRYGTGQKRHPSSVMAFNRELGLHPTQKPVALFEYLIKTYTNEGDTVLDNCAGSGTTGIACLNTNRNFILIEKERKYVQLIKKRLQSL